MRWPSIALLCSFTSAALAAAPATPAARLKAESEERARAEVGDLFRALCPEQCVLLSAEARVVEESVGDPAPGFDPGAARVPALRGTDVSVLVDARLPAPFRARVKALVAQRLRSLGAGAQVTVEAVPFPPRAPPEPALPPAVPAAPAMSALAQPAPAAAPLAAAPAAAALPQAAAPRSDRLADRLIEAAPMLIALVLLAATLLALGALALLALRRRDEPLYEPMPAAEPAASAASEIDPAEAALTHERRARLLRSMAEERALRNAVLREALARGETAHVASWVRELGDFLLEDLRGDTALAPRLLDLAGEVVRAGKAGASARAVALLELEGRVIAARLSRATESVDEAFLFLEGVQADRFAAACRELPPTSLEVALRFCPPRLREAALPQLAAEQREQLALAWARRPTLPPSVALAVAAELRARLADSAGGPSQAQRMLTELLDALPRAQQDALVERLRRDGDGSVLRGLVTESALAGAPRDVLAAALLAVPPAQLIAFLSGCDAALRETLLAACPGRLQAELRDELRAPPRARDEFLAARREVLSRLRDEAARTGASLTDPSPAGAGERPRLLSTAS